MPKRLAAGPLASSSSCTCGCLSNTSCRVLSLFEPLLPSSRAQLCASVHSCSLCICSCCDAEARPHKRWHEAVSQHLHQSSLGPVACRTACHRHISQDEHGTANASFSRYLDVAEHTLLNSARAFMLHALQPIALSHPAAGKLVVLPGSRSPLLPRYPIPACLPPGFIPLSFPAPFLPHQHPSTCAVPSYDQCWLQCCHVSDSGLNARLKCMWGQVETCSNNMCRS